MFTARATVKPDSAAYRAESEPSEFAYESRNLAATPSEQ